MIIILHPYLIMNDYFYYTSYYIIKKIVAKVSVNVRNLPKNKTPISGEVIIIFNKYGINGLKFGKYTKLISIVSHEKYKSFEDHTIVIKEPYIDYDIFYPMQIKDIIRIGGIVDDDIIKQYRHLDIEIYKNDKITKYDIYKQNIVDYSLTGVDHDTYKLLQCSFNLYIDGGLGHNTILYKELIAAGVEITDKVKLEYNNVGKSEINWIVLFCDEIINYISLPCSVRKVFGMKTYNFLDDENFNRIVGKEGGKEDGNKGGCGRNTHNTLLQSNILK